MVEPAELVVVKTVATVERVPFEPAPAVLLVTPAPVELPVRVMRVTTPFDSVEVRTVALPGIVDAATVRVVVYVEPALFVVVMTTPTPVGGTPMAPRVVVNG